MTDKQSKSGRLWDYKIVSVIGRGATAVVYKVRHIRSRHLFALKKVNIANLSEGEKVQMYREVRFLSKIDDRRIVRLFQSFISNNHLYMVLQLVEGGDLSRLIALKKQKSSFWLEGELLGMFLQLLQILSFLHQRNIMHRDIKVQNILLDLQQNFKLADLGLARHISSDHEQERVGTPAYFAPQLLLHRNYNQKIDIWALGCVFYNLAALRHPFQGLTLNTLPNYVLESDPPPLKNYSPRVSQVVFGMLSKDMDDRPSAQQLIDFISQSPESRPPNRLRIFNLECLKQLKLSEIEKQPLESDQLSPTRIVPSLGQIVDMIDSQCRRASQRVQLSPIKKQKIRYENYLHSRRKKDSLGLTQMRTSSVPKSSGFDLKELRRELSLGRDD